MPWLQLILECSADDAPLYSDLLSEQGAAAVTMVDSADQPLFEPAVGTTPLWNNTRVVGLFETDVDLDAVLLELAAARAPEPLPPLRIEQLEDKDWNRAWMDTFQPMRFGERVWIVPSWHTPPDERGVNILLDPGLAFGTGTHPTTRLCLEWLDAHPPRNAKVIDYGCGSGILAIAAALLGAESVLCIDNDPQALIATRDNAERNKVAGKLTAMLPESASEAPCDLLLANILAGPLMELAEKFSRLVKPQGHVVLSGILPEQAEAVRESYLPWFAMAVPVEHDGWIRLEGQRK
ncbi:MAG TPA: 50S ribosomal protein L11 methyltransferase [Gammaproteobacteria bacterium]